MCSSMKQPKPDRLVDTDGIPMTVHSADRQDKQCILVNALTSRVYCAKWPRGSNLACSPMARSKRGRRRGGSLSQSPHSPSVAAGRWMKGTLGGR